MIEWAELTSETSGARHAPLCGASDELIGRESGGRVGFTLNLHLHFAADSFLRCRQAMLSTSKLQTSLRLLLRTRGQRSPIARSIATTGVAGGTQGPNAYCKNLVLKRDYQAFLTSQTFPEEHRGAVFALRAFYVSTFVPSSVDILTIICIVGGASYDSGVGLKLCDREDAHAILEGRCQGLS